jgi:predicted CopG family antitoxin
MRLKNIAVSATNYQVLKDLGRAGESFNDVISELITRVLNIKKLQSERGLEAPAQTGHQSTQ